MLLEHIRIQIQGPLNIEKRKGGNTLKFISLCDGFWTVSIFHSCEVQTEISVSRVTVWYYEALPSDAKAWPERRNFLSVSRTTMIDTFSCIPFINLFHVIKCIKCVGFAITRPRYTGMHNLLVRTTATDANWTTAQKKNKKKQKKKKKRLLHLNV